MVSLRRTGIVKEKSTMKKQNRKSKLALARDTVRQLGASELIHIEGGSSGHQGQTQWQRPTGVIDPTVQITMQTL